MRGFVAVHTGAGKYSTNLSPLYAKACKRACQKGAEILNEDGSAVDAAVASTIVLEDDPVTNAGYGSNLTIDGNVECDATLIDGYTLTCGSVGAVAGIKNPILLAKSLHDAQLNSALALGRIPPCTIVGEGALNYAKRCNVPLIDPRSLISHRARRQYQKYKQKLESYHSSEIVNSLTSLDTVGVVCVDSEGRVAATSSSGGILLKESGRVGSAGVYGAGCWAENGREQGQPCIAVSTSGCGEHIIKTCLSRDVARRFQSCQGLPAELLSQSVKEQFLESPFLKNVRHKLCGVLVLYQCDSVAELLWAHTTPDMCIGYRSVSSRKTTVHHSKMESSSNDSVLVSSVNASL